MFSFVPCVLQGVPFWHSDAYCCYCYCCVVVVYVVVSCLRLSFLVLLLSLRCSPLLLLQVSDSSTFHIMCDVPSIAVFCSESVECFPGTASKFFLKRLVTIPVAPIINGITVHFGSTFVASLYTNCCILTSFPVPFAQHFCLRVLPHLSVYYYYYYYYYYYLLTAIELSLGGSSPYTSTDKT